MRVGIFKNASTEIASGDNNNVNENGASVCSTVFLDADDAVVLKAYSNSGGNVVLFGGESICYFGGFRITGGPVA